MADILKLNLEECILVNDLKRLKDGHRPIKSIHRLSLLMVARYDLDYDIVVYMLYKAQKKGYQQHDKVIELERLIVKICEVLDTKRDDLVQVIEL
ncbi:hypothetical protein [Maribacter polysiphoniae]|uniref:hypothetical protein n=1 Tax=Maribacter polysiphoniae TaxID=429344 RepID=UPI0023533C58|nr:hypothetical protein [Maribacter polysiphoniae]